VIGVEVTPSCLWRGRGRGIRRPALV